MTKRRLSKGRLTLIAGGKSQQKCGKHALRTLVLFKTIVYEKWILLTTLIASLWKGPQKRGR